VSQSVPEPALETAGGGRASAFEPESWWGVTATMAVGIGLIYVLGSNSVMGGFQKLEQKDATTTSPAFRTP